MRRLPARYTLLIIGAIALVAAACGSVPSGPAAIQVKDAFTRPSPSAGGTGGAFLTVTNGASQPDRLVSAASPAAGMVELHETIDDNGVMRMEPRPQGFEVAANGTLELKPGGKHIMLMGLKAPLSAGDTIEITLTFEKAGAVVVKVPVREQ